MKFLVSKKAQGMSFGMGKTVTWVLIIIAVLAIIIIIVVLAPKLMSFLENMF